MAAATTSPQDLSALMEQLKVGSDIPSNSYPDTNPVDVYRCYITDELSKLTGVAKATIYPALSWTNTLDKGDLILAVPRLQIKGSKPADKAEEIAKSFPSNPFTKQPEAVSISVKFEFSPTSVVPLVLQQVYEQGEKYGENQRIGVKSLDKPSEKKKVIIEFSSPNIAKKFHIGHLRSTIIGSFLSKLYETLGWDVTRMNYLGDWGRQYGLLAIAWQRYGNEAAFQEDPITHLFEIYVKISADLKPEEDAYAEAKKRKEDTNALENQGLLGEAKRYFKLMEEGDKEALALWSRFRGVSVERYKESYARLGVFFDEYSGESKVPQEIMNEAEQILKDRGIATYSDGAWLIEFAKHGAKKLGTCIIRNRNGTSNYLLRDVGEAIKRWRNYKVDQLIYVVMDEQNLHLQQLFKILELMGEPYATYSKNMQHVTFGRIMGMSTRKGTVKFLGDVLDDIAESMHDVMRKNEVKYAQVEDPDKTADLLGMSSMIVQDMGGKRINTYVFDIDRMTSFEGDTGPYLQYAHARLCSIARKTGYTREQLKSADFSLLKEKHAIDLVRLMASWPDTVLHTYDKIEASTIVTYLFKLTHQLSSSYDVLQVIGAPEGPEVSLARAALYEGARQIINNALRLIGLVPVNRM